MTFLHPRSDYTKLNLEPTPESAAILDSNPHVQNVSADFARLSTYGDLLAAHDGGAFTGRRQNRYTSLNQHGKNAAVNHLQGLQRLRRGQYFILSGGDSSEPVSHLFVVRMGSRRPIGAWGSNLLHGGSPPEQDGIVRVIALDSDRWHAGGLGLLGEILAVPLEGNGRSRVVFLDVRDPENPTLFPKQVDRPAFTKAGAVALTKLPSGRFLCIVWREEGDVEPKGRLDFYLSKSERFFDGFRDEVRTVQFPGLRVGANRDPQYQTISLLSPKEANTGSVAVHLLGLENGSGTAPFGNGPNLADLFELSIAPDGIAKPTGTNAPSLRHVDSREFHAPREFCNFDSASGIYVTAKGRPEAGEAGSNLSLYAAYHWRVEQTFRFAEFVTPPDPTVSITDIAQAWVELYEHDQFRGRRLSLRSLDDSIIPDYGRIYVQDGDFNERVTGARYQIPDGWSYRLYRERNFQGTRTGQDFIDLRGTGLVVETPDLGRAIGDAVSSSQYVQG